MKMENSFWFGYEVKNFIFPGFDIVSPAGMIAVCIGTSMLVVLFESFKTTRIIKQLKSRSLFSGTSVFKLAFSISTEKSSLIDRPENNTCRKYREIWRVSDIFIHFFELLVGYLLMAIAMSFNGYLMISIGVGGLLGYMLYGSVLFNVAAQVVVHRIMCAGCEIKADTQAGDTTPFVETVNEEGMPSGSRELNLDEADADDEAVTTVQVHHES